MNLRGRWRRRVPHGPGTVFGIVYTIVLPLVVLVLLIVLAVLEDLDRPKSPPGCHRHSAGSTTTLVCDPPKPSTVRGSRRP